jgi:hypothetical protein
LDIKGKNIMRITETQLKKLIRESVKETLGEQKKTTWKPTTPEEAYLAAAGECQGDEPNLEAANYPMGPSDFTRNLASKNAHWALLYSMNVDEAPHPVTLKGVLQRPTEALEYLSVHASHFIKLMK